MAASLLMLSAIGPILWGWWVHRHTTLVHVFFWVVVAWLAWLVASQMDAWQNRYLAVVLTSCAGVAVLGARRPGARAWHAVVAGLAAVLLLPLAESFFSRGDSATTDNLRWVFLAGAASVGILNYLPTRLGPASVSLLIAVGIELWLLRWSGPEYGHRAAVLLAGLSPWLAALLGSRRRDIGDDSTQLWCSFRDRFGVVWAWRLREQFNSSSHHRKLGLALSWRGLRRTDGAPLSREDQTVAIELLRALMGRFGVG
jgi:hypothetical protein